MKHLTSCAVAALSVLLGGAVAAAQPAERPVSDSGGAIPIVIDHERQLALVPTGTVLPEGLRVFTGRPGTPSHRTLVFQYAPAERFDSTRRILDLEAARRPAATAQGACLDRNFGIEIYPGNPGTVLFADFFTCDPGTNQQMNYVFTTFTLGIDYPADPYVKGVAGSLDISSPNNPVFTYNTSCRNVFFPSTCGRVDIPSAQPASITVTGEERRIYCLPPDRSGCNELYSAGIEASLPILK